MHLELITDSPKNLSWGEITSSHTHLLERDINKHPEFWLWSHNRWKRKLPKNIEELRLIQKETFNQKFKY
jgi:KDO2-lipid IV(A) lauroyltransferase